VDAPETQYGRTADGVRVAYQVVGDGVVDIVLLLSGQYPIDVLWDFPDAARFLRRLASFSRLVLFDPHGWGASEAAAPTFETFVDDVTTVMGAIGSDRATVVGFSEGGPVGILFAATYPERVSGLVLLNTFARWTRADDYPCGVPARGAELLFEALDTHWGTGLNALANPTLAGDESFRAWMARCERLGAPPSMAVRETREWMGRDLRPILSSVQVRTLVLHRAGDAFIRVGNGRYLAERINGAKYVELPGDDHLFCVGDQDAILDEIEEFITGAPAVRTPDRALATVLFTDIVSSTEQAAKLGDRAWTQVLDRHDAVVSRELNRHRGRKVNPTGDGMLATFDGPARAVRCALAICQGVRTLGIEVRAGLHTGEVELRGDDIGGIAVHIGQRVSALAGPGEVFVSRTVTDLVVGSGLEFTARGEHELKGVPGTWAVFAVLG
jgi:class 3 adenylate cyclase